MRLKKLIENENEEEFSEMSLADGLDMLIDLLEEDELSSNEVGIISKMFELLDEEMDDDEEESDYDSLEEAATIVQHSKTAEKRLATFKKTAAGERIKKRIQQRRYRRKPEVKTKARRRAARQKTCGKNQTAQLSRHNSSSYVCKIKDRLRSKLMARVARIYGRR